MSGITRCTATALGDGHVSAAVCNNAVMGAGPKWLFVLASIVCALAAGCGASTGISDRATSPAHASARSRGTVRTHTLVAHRSADPCRPASLEGWQFAAVHFLSARVGVGITAAGVSCPVSSEGGTVTWRWQAEPVRVAVTRDAGRMWRAEGVALPVASSGSQPIDEQVVASSTRNVYVLAGDGEVLWTSNAGVRWARQPVPRPVFQLAMSGGTVWALACPAMSNRATTPALIGLHFCRPVLERVAAQGGPWTQVRIPPPTHVLEVHLAVASKNLQALDIDHPGGGSGELLYTLDGGRRWSRERDPAWDGYPCLGTGMFAAAPPHAWWILCLGGAAAGSSTKGLLQTTDYGRRWTTVSQITSLLTTQLPGSTSISRAEPDALAAGSSTRLWLAYQNSMGESGNGGATWTNVPGINPQGIQASFNVLSSTHAWLAVPGEGLWRTTDGSHWTLATALKPCLSSQMSLQPGPRISEPTEQSTRLFVLANVSPSACSLDGYPTVALLDDHGVRLPLRYRDGGDQVLTSRPPHRVTLLPLDQAYEAINKNACIGRDSAIAARVRFSLPDEGGTLTMALARHPLLDYCPAGDPGHVLDIGPFGPAPNAVFASHR
jgi:hypothetical protein